MCREKARRKQLEISTSSPVRCSTGTQTAQPLQDLQDPMTADGGFLWNVLKGLYQNGRHSSIRDVLEALYSSDYERISMLLKFAEQDGFKKDDVIDLIRICTNLSGPRTVAISRYLALQIGEQWTLLDERFQRLTRPSQHGALS